MLGQDQLVGMTGEAAFSIYMTGSIQWWLATRVARNHCPYTGDSGTDLICLRNVDVKTTVPKQPYGMDETCLIVNPRDRRPGTVYVLALIERWDPTSVVLAGWVTDENLPPIGTQARFARLHAIPARSLAPLPPWWWLSQASGFDL